MYNNSFEKVVMPKSIYVYFQHDYSFYYIHYEIASDPCNLIGYHSCDLFMNHTISCSKCISFLTRDSFTEKQPPITFQGLFKETDQIAGKRKTSFVTFYKSAQNWINKLLMYRLKKPLFR